jgi:hypothetical protein
METASLSHAIVSHLTTDLNRDTGLAPSGKIRLAPEYRFG